MIENNSNILWANCCFFKVWKPIIIDTWYTGFFGVNIMSWYCSHQESFLQNVILFPHMGQCSQNFSLEFVYPPVSTFSQGGIRTRSLVRFMKPRVCSWKTGLKAPERSINNAWMPGSDPAVTLSNPLWSLNREDLPGTPQKKATSIVWIWCSYRNCRFSVAISCHSYKPFKSLRNGTT